jgi:multiple sugar transport system substrate-binding protein
MSKRKKSLRSVAVAAAAALVLGACGLVGSPSSPSSTEPVELNLILVAQASTTALLPLIPEFEKSSGIKVNVQQLAQQQARDKIFVTLSSKSTDLDVFNFLPSNEGYKWQPAGLLEDLDPYMSKETADYDPKGFTPAMLDASRIGKQLTGLPVLVEGPVVFYRKDLLATYSVTVPKTIDELVAAAKKIYTESNGRYVTVTRGLSPVMAYTFGNFLHNMGLEWVDETGKPTFTDARAIKAIKDYVELAAKTGPQGAVNNGPVQNASIMVSGNAVFMIDSSNQAETLFGPESKIKDNLGVIPLPPGPGGSHPTLLSWDLGISKFSKHKNEAWQFLRWATSPQIMLKVAEGGVGPSRDKLWQEPSFLKFYDTPVKKEWVSSVLEIVKTGVGQVGPPAEEQGAARQIIGDEIGKVMLGTQTAEEAAANIQKGLTPLVRKPGG